MWRRIQTAGWLSVVLCALPANGLCQTADQPVDFARQVLPILSNKCFVCHGPDTKKKDLLRLDSYAGATRDLGGYRAIDPENLAESRILSRIHDAEDPMPPRKAAQQLTPKERDILSRWVEGGGKYARHWAFVPPRKREAAEAAHPVDGFVHAGLRAAGVQPGEPAQREVLARRVSLVLTGLPPRPALLEAYRKDNSEGAYGRLVDGLLADPRFGEHQARYWLDAVRYGDTHGLHLDNRRGIYPYRDWVVRAFNENLGLDEFITWQLAGDLLPAPTMAQRVATGYVRMNPSTAEGGAIPAEFQAKNSFDRTENFGTVMLGMSMTCARCHTHKYDPIQQTEYYRLLAFFNSTAESPMDGNSYTYAPVLEVPKDQVGWKGWNQVQARARELLQQAGVSDADAELLSHAKSCDALVARNWRISEVMSATASAPSGELPPAKQLPGKLGRVKPGPGKAVWVAFEVEVPVDQTLWLKFAGGEGSRALVDGAATPAPQMAGDSRRGYQALPLSKGVHEVRLQLIGAATAVPVEVTIVNPWRSLARTKRWSACSLQDQLWMLGDPDGPLGESTQRRQAQQLAAQMATERLGFTTTLVARDLGKPRPVRVLRRGEYDLPVGEELEPGVPAVMGAFPADAPRNRLGLARWLTNRRHPLTSRVLVNRIWQRVFGDGLVRTPEDFGRQGEQPTHPHLLDWLAVELQDRDWDLKHMLRLLVTSQTFRQSSARRSELDDPENRLLARGPSFRLDAEVIRDLALWASDLLRSEMGGEGVKPYQPGGMWLALAHPGSNTKRYVQDTGDRLYRRSLYLYWKRTSPHPMMTLFDAPSRESSCVVRSSTSTPLQSLGLFNETQRLEMARVFAGRLLRSHDNDAGRLDLMFQLLACRQPTEVERAACARLLEAMRRRYKASEVDAEALLSRTGSAPRDPGVASFELAAWTQVTITVLASDVAIMLY